jgi:hypothetical protein
LLALIFSRKAGKIKIAKIITKNKGFLGGMWFIDHRGLRLALHGLCWLAGKETYCFAWREGWALMRLYAIMIPVNLLGKEYESIIRSRCPGCGTIIPTPP